jgi:hypothetical protein
VNTACMSDFFTSEACPQEEQRATTRWTEPALGAPAFSALIPTPPSARFDLCMFCTHTVDNSREGVAVLPDRPPDREEREAGDTQHDRVSRLPPRAPPEAGRRLPVASTLRDRATRSVKQVCVAPAWATLSRATGWDGGPSTFRTRFRKAGSLRHGPASPPSFVSGPMPGLISGSRQRERYDKGGGVCRRIPPRV